MRDAWLCQVGCIRVSPDCKTDAIHVSCANGLYHHYGDVPFRPNMKTSLPSWSLQREKIARNLKRCAEMIGAGLIADDEQIHSRLSCNGRWVRPKSPNFLFFPCVCKEASKYILDSDQPKHTSLKE